LSSGPRAAETPDSRSGKESKAAPARKGDKGSAPKAAAPKSEPKTAPGAEAPESGGAKDPVHEEFLRINYLFNRELYDLAIPRYEALLLANPAYAGAGAVHYALALCHYNLAAQTKPAAGSGASGAAPAAAAGKEAARPEPLGPAREKGGDGAAAAAAAGGAKPAGADPVRSERLKKAVQHLKEALRRKDFEPRLEATRILGQSLLLLADHENAAKAFQFITERQAPPREALLASLGLAEALYFQGKHAEAAAAFRKVLALGPQDEDLDRTEFYLAMSLYREGGQAADESAAVFARIAAKPSSPYAGDARYMKALVLQAKGDDAGAVTAFRELVKSGATQYAELARFGLATAFFRSQKHKEAAAELEAFGRDFPASDRKDLAAVLLARSYLETGKGTAGAKMLQDLRESPTAGDEAALWLARLYARHGKHKPASTVLAAAIKSFPESRHREALELELVTALLGEGNFEAAGEKLAKLEAAGNSGSARADQVAYLKAYALHRAGKHAESLAACERFRAEHARSAHLVDVDQLTAENHFAAKDYEQAAAAYARHTERFKAQLTALARLKADLRRAQALYLAKKFPEALAILSALEGAAAGGEEGKALAEDPFFASRRYLAGDCAYQLKDHARAREELGRFLDDAARAAAAAGADPALAEQANDARFKIAHSLQQAGDTAAARAAYRRALEADPKTPHREQIQFELGQLAYGEKDWDAAARAFTEAAAAGSSPRFAPHALRFLGWMAFEKQDYLAAAKHYGRLATSFPDHELAPEAELQMALSLQAAGRKDDAREVLRRFKAKRPDDPRLGRVQLEEATLLAKDGKHQEALAALEKLAADAPPELLASVLYETAWCKRALQDLDGAAAAYGRILELEGAGTAEVRETTVVELAELEFERREYARAREILDRASSVKGPRREKVLYRLAWSQHMLGDARQTIAAYEALEKEFPKSELLAEIGILAAKAHLQEGRHARAAQVFRAIADAKGSGPEAEAALLGLAECLAEERKFDEARKRFQAFIQKHPESPSLARARFGIAWADENAGKLDEAVALYRQVARESASAIGARAQFQIGQCLVAKKNYRDAIAELLQVPAAYAYPEWAAKAVLQAAGCFEALGDLERAKKYYGEVVANYEGRDEAKLAKERLDRLEVRG
jgi:TolA-binding protein